MVRSLSIRLAAAWAILLVLGGGLDLHFAGESDQAAHGLFGGGHASNESVYVAAEPCASGGAAHVEAAEARAFRPCPLCLRKLDERGLEPGLARVAGVAATPRTSLLDPGHAPASRAFSPNPVRGPPIA